jgi:mannan endo-1,4-beta-mannosidase
LPQPWIRRAPDAPYFITDAGTPWTPIGQNDSISWIEFAGLQQRRDLSGIRRHLAWLVDHGVTCLRLMLEYSQTGQHFFEQPAGHFNPAMVQLWDDLFALASEAGLRILLTPLDTYFHYVRWDLHPYNQVNGGPCAERTRLMTHPEVRALIKARLAFGTERWGGDGTLFAWDLWNEMHPVQGEDRRDCFDDYIGDVGPYLREVENRLHGTAHLQTVSIFGPELHWKPWLNAPVFRHGALDFANNHFYEEGTIDHPSDTVAPALATARLVREALAEIVDGRPFFDTEHGPIHTFKDHGITLPESFDDEYFRHMQWAHLAAGGAGGGMRWPNRHPHRLTTGMREAQRALSAFLPLIDWPRFRRRPVDISCTDPATACIACADSDQAVLFLLRTGPHLPDGRLDPAPQAGVTLVPPAAGLATFFDPVRGTVMGQSPVAGTSLETPPFGPCLMIAIR